MTSSFARFIDDMQHSGNRKFSSISPIIAIAVLTGIGLLSMKLISINPTNLFLSRL